MKVAALLAVAVLLLAPLLMVTSTDVAAGGTVVLTVGHKEEMKSRSVLRVQLGPFHSDPWSVGVLEPVYSSLLITDPVSGELRPYIAKGIDADGSGVFDPDEYGAFGKDRGTNATNLTVYFDFNGARWHDGVQMTAMDLMFTFLLASVSPLYNSATRVLWDRAGAPTSNFTWDRWLAVEIAPKSWAGEASLLGDAALRSAVRFRLQAPYARFYEDLLGKLPILPRHIWELTGGGRHLDFGRAIYPEGHPRAGQPIPVNETLYKPFDYLAADAWQPTDADVVGSGPLRFTTWKPGVYTQLDRYEAFYVGTDPRNPSIVYDARLAAMLHPPLVASIVFKVYRTDQLGVFALENGEIQYYHATVPLEWIPDLLYRWGIRVWANADLGYTYLGYNLRRPPFGYSAYPPANPTRDDAGLAFRLAFSHLVDKASIVLRDLQNYGVTADSPVSPANTFWYNRSMPRVAYDPALANLILDTAGWTDPPGDCQVDGTGCRSLPGIETRVIEILTPQADYERISASVSSMMSWAARSAGLNVVSKPMTFGALGDAIIVRDFDMYIRGWRIQTTDPDFLFTAFDCSGSQDGSNYAGYCDSEFDGIIERSRTEMNASERQRQVKWAQGVLMADRPVEPLYFPHIIEATRQDRFVNWTVRYGTLWTYWSWIGVRPVTQPRPIQVTVRYDTAMASEARQRIEAAVKDLGGEPIQGATVTFRILPADGGRFAEAASPNITGTTRAGGTFAATYVAPLVLGGPRDIAIETVVTQADVPSPVQRGLVITVFPGVARFLGFRVSFPAGDIGLPDTPLPIRLEVHDESGVAVDDAAVRGSVEPANATLSRTNGTAREMAAILFSPPRDLQVTLPYRISLRAEKPGHYSAYSNVSLLIVYRPAIPAPPPSQLPATPWPWIIAGGISVAVLVALAFARRTLRIRGRNRPKT